MWHKRSKKNWEELKLNVAVAEVQLSSQFVKNDPQLGRGGEPGGTLPNVLADDTINISPMFYQIPDTPRIPGPVSQ